MEKEKEEAETDYQEKRQTAEERIVKSTLPFEKKKETLKEAKIIKGQISKELERKVNNSLVDETISKFALEEQIKNLLNYSQDCQKSLKKYQQKEIEISQFKEKKIGNFYFKLFG